MAVYTQAELVTLYQKAIPGLDDWTARRYADIIEKFYGVMPSTYLVGSGTGYDGKPEAQVATAVAGRNTSDFLGRTTRSLVEIATAAYGQHLSLANLILKIKELGYPDIWATNAAPLIVAIYATIPDDLHDECVSDGTTFASTWVAGGDFAIAGSSAVYTHGTAAGTMTQVDTNFAHAITADRWYMFDYEITAVPEVAANLTSMVITSAAGVPAADVSIKQTAIGKYTEVFFSGSAQGTGHDFIITGASTDTVATYTIDNISLKLIDALLSANPLATVSSTNLTSTWCKPKIAKIVQECASLLRQGENMMWNI